MINENLGRKHREKLFKKNEILNAAKESFALKGYINTTIEEIAAKSEFGKGTIYNYFTDKESIYNEIIFEISKDYFQIIFEADRCSTDFKEFLTYLSKKVLEYSYKNKDAFLVYVRDRLEKMSDSKWIEDNQDNFTKEINDIFINRIELAQSKAEIQNIPAESLMVFYRSFLFPYLFQIISSNKKKENDAANELTIILSIMFNGMLKKEKV